MEAWSSFSSSYLFRHTAGLYVALLICGYAEDRLRNPKPLNPKPKKT